MEDELHAGVPGGPEQRIGHVTAASDGSVVPLREIAVTRGVLRRRTELDTVHAARALQSENGGGGGGAVRYACRGRTGD